MQLKELLHIFAAILIFAIVSSLSLMINSSWISIPKILLFSAIIVLVTVFAKKLIAYMLDSDVEHELWEVYRYGFRPSSHFNNPIPAGIILPLGISIISLGFVKFAGILTYETRALKSRVAKRFGSYSFAEMTDWHTGIIGASGIVALLILTIIAYFLPTNLEYLAKMATIYAFWNMLPISNLDGTQIFFGSRIAYSILAAITAIFTIYALII